jgi:hypothetical protein
MPPNAHQASAQAEQDSEHDDQNHLLGAKKDEAPQCSTALVPE